MASYIVKSVKNSFIFEEEKNKDRVISTSNMMQATGACVQCWHNYTHTSC
jgi:hypothetical protein